MNRSEAAWASAPEIYSRPNTAHRFILNFIDCLSASMEDSPWSKSRHETRRRRRRRRDNHDTIEE